MSAAPILQVDRLSKNFRGLAAIADVSFAIEPGSITSIIGPNGAGKSTLFNLVTGYLPPTAGEIRFQGRPITGKATNRIAELGIARAFQIARPFRDLTVFENVRIGALFGKAGPRDVVATTHRAMELASIASLAEQPASSLTVGQLRHLEVGDGDGLAVLAMGEVEQVAGQHGVGQRHLVDRLAVLVEMARRVDVSAAVLGHQHHRQADRQLGSHAGRRSRHQLDQRRPEARCDRVQQ